MYISGFPTAIFNSKCDKSLVWFEGGVLLGIGAMQGCRKKIDVGWVNSK